MLKNPRSKKKSPEKVEEFAPTIDPLTKMEVKNIIKTETSVKPVKQVQKIVPQQKDQDTSKPKQPVKTTAIMSDLLDAEHQTPSDIFGDPLSGKHSEGDEVEKELEKERLQREKELKERKIKEEKEREKREKELREKREKELREKKEKEEKEKKEQTEQERIKKELEEQERIKQEQEEKAKREKEEKAIEAAKEPSLQKTIWDSAADMWSPRSPTTPEDSTAATKSKEKSKEDAKKALDDILGKKAFFEEEDEYDPNKASTINFKTDTATNLTEATKRKGELNKCAKCKGEIDGKMVRAKNQTWHPQCFVCFACDKPFPKGQYAVFEEEAFCNEQCVEKRCCDKCQKLIKETEFVEASNKVYHSGCLCCDMCEKPFPGGEYVSQDGLLMCKKCVSGDDVDVSNFDIGEGTKLEPVEDGQDPTSSEVVDDDEDI